MKSTDLNHPPPKKKGKKGKKHAYPLDSLSGLKTNKQFLSFKLRNYKIHSFWLKSMVFCWKSVVFSLNLWFSWNPCSFLLENHADFSRKPQILAEIHAVLMKSAVFCKKSTVFSRKPQILTVGPTYNLRNPQFLAKIHGFQPKTVDLNLQFSTQNCGFKSMVFDWKLQILAKNHRFAVSVWMLSLRLENCWLRSKG